MLADVCPRLMHYPLALKLALLPFTFDGRESERDVARLPAEL